MKYIKKTKPALWTTIPGSRKLKPDSTGQSPRKIYGKASVARNKRAPSSRKHIKPESDSRAKLKRQYRARVKEFLKGKTCGGVPATEVHHKYGRRGRLLLWELGWLAVSGSLHCWIHDNPKAAMTLGMIGPKGTWNNFDAAWRHEQAIRTNALTSALRLYQEHHEPRKSDDSEGLNFYGKH